MSVEQTIFVVSKQRHSQRGIKLFEVAVATAVFTIIVTVLLLRLWYYQDRAEEVAVQQVVNNIRSALEIEVAQGRLLGKAVDLTMLMEKNPLELLTNKPANYLGEFFSPADSDVTVGNWYFDRYDKTLVYLLNNRSTFGSAPVKRLKFQVKLFRLPKNVVKPPGTTAPDGVAFEQVNG